MKNIHNLRCVDGITVFFYTNAISGRSWENSYERNVSETERHFQSENIFSKCFYALVCFYAMLCFLLGLALSKLLI